MNKVNVFRVDNPMMFLYIAPVGIGPYYFFGHVAGKEKCNKWADHCGKHEPGPNIYNKFGIDNCKLKSVPTLPNERRPGPFEDMEMREPLAKILGMSKGGKDYFYCFDSIAQFKSWFHDPEELKFLYENYFTLSHYIVNAASFICGSKQAAFFKEGFMYLKTRYNILTLDQLLPTYGPPKPKPTPIIA
jgi:hypothetical protein